MLEAISKLMEVQRLDNLIADAEEKLAGVPDYLEKAQNELETAQAEFDDFKGKYDTDLGAKNEIQTNYEENKALLEKAQLKLPEVKNNKEYEAVLKEMDVLKKTVNDAEEKLVVLSESVDKYQAADDGVISKLENAKKTYEESLQKREEENSDLTSELASNKKKPVKMQKKV